MPRIILTCFLILSIVNYSCQSTLIYTRAQKPKIELSSPGDRIYFVSRTGEITAEEGRKAAQTYPETYNIFLKNLDLDFRNRLYITLIAPDTSEFMNNLLGMKVLVTTENDRLSWEESISPLPDSLVSGIFSRGKTKYLLILDYYSFFSEKNTETVENEDGSISSTAYHAMFSTATLSLYRSPGILADRSAVNISGPLAESASLDPFGILSIGPSGRRFLKVAGQQAEALSFAYLDLYFPSERRFMENYYTTKEFKSITPLMKNMELGKANLLLHQLYPRAEPVSARRIAWNIYIVNKALGNDDEAELWKHKALTNSD
ncbi:MAG TPA: hypothetical protein VI583_06980 [Cyclobacteriaceae bacterium]|nr:hypothetical protein [Cyclobacteriaceae bacterium]